MICLMTTIKPGDLVPQSLLCSCALELGMEDLKVEFQIEHIWGFDMVTYSVSA